MSEPCKRCEGSGKRLIPSVTGKAESRGTAFVEAPCGLCGGSGVMTAPHVPSDNAAVEARIVAWLRKEAAGHWGAAIAVGLLPTDRTAHRCKAWNDAADAIERRAHRESRDGE